jgi:hypothetical protein
VLLALTELEGAARGAASEPAPEPSAHTKEAAPSHAGAALSLPDSAPQAGGIVSSPSQPVSVAKPAGDELAFDVSGYLHAPLRLSWGPPTQPGPAGNAGRQLRTPPLVPDANYIDYRYTSNLAGPWSELNFHYGNALARATIQIASYNLTDAGYRRLESNLGINQAYLALNPKPWLSGRLRLSFSVGAFADRYGAAGRYDAGKYETYLFGRTHLVGETLRVSYAISDDVGLVVEHGFGGKLEPTPFFGAPTGPRDNLSWDPYPGPVAQESTFVQHGHAGLLLFGQLLLGAHVIHVFASDNERAGSYLGSSYGGRPSSEASPRLLIYGADLKLTGSDFGDGYIGFAHLDARNADYLGDAVEVLHSFNGWQLHDNFFGDPGAAERATGKIDSILFQHIVSLATLLPPGTPLVSNGADLTLAAFGMWNSVSGATNPLYDVKKLKWGAELMYSPLEWLALGGRFDRVSPNLSHSEQAFSVISPRIVLRTSWVSHEQISLSYHHYYYGSAARSSSYPYNAQPGAAGLGADSNAAQLAATLWF